MSCNDDNPIMTYKSVAQRLNLSADFDVKAIVASRPELFRPGILKSRLDAWKDKMRTGLKRPNWIVEIRDFAEQRKVIDSLTREDVFRNQFRVDEEAPKSNIEIIEWGLQHIDRLRKAAAEERDTRLRLWASVVVPVVSILVAGVSVVSSVWLQRISMKEQAELKHYEVDLLPKQRAYSTFSVASASAVSDVVSHDKQDLLKQFLEMELALSSLEAIP